MASSDANVLDVRDSHALLCCCGPRESARGLPKEDGLELQHASNGEQHGGVRWDEGSPLHARVPLAFVEAQEFLSYLCSAEFWWLRFSDICHAGCRCTAGICAETSLKVRDKQRRSPSKRLDSPALNTR